MDDGFLFAFGWVIKHDAEQKPVKLRLWERISPFHLNWVLSCQHEERLRQIISATADGDFALLHCLQQCRLSFRRRSVDFVGENDVGENRSGHELKPSPSGFGVLLQHIRAQNVAGHQIGRELNSLETQIQNLRKGADEQSFG